MSEPGVVTLLGSVAAAALERIGSIDGRWLLLALGLQLAHLTLRALAWRNAIAAAYPDRSVPVTRLAAAYVAGVALNSVLPARGGEAAKIALARTQIRRSSLGTLASASAVVLVFDAAMTVVLLLGAWGFGVVPGLPAPTAPPGATLAAEHPVAAVVLAVAVVAGLALAFGRVRPRLYRLGGQLAQGLAVLRAPSRYAREVASLQLAAWACRLGVAFFLLAAFGLEATVPLAALVVVAGGLSTLVPVTPGGVGAHQALLAYALHETASTATAVSFSVGMQATVGILNVAVGVAALMLLFGTVRPKAWRNLSAGEPLVPPRAPSSAASR